MHAVVKSYDIRHCRVIRITIVIFATKATTAKTQRNRWWKNDFLDAYNKM